MTKAIAGPDPNPVKPKYLPPSCACDAHCHIFGPAAKFPYAPERRYTPPDSPKEKLRALHERLGFSRAVLVQASCHGADNRAMLDAIAWSGKLEPGGAWRGVAMVAESAARSEHPQPESRFTTSCPSRRPWSSRRRSACCGEPIFPIPT